MTLWILNINDILLVSKLPTMAKAQRPKKEKRAKKVKLKSFKFYGFNTILTPKEKQSDEAYSGYMKKIFDDDVHILISPDKKMTLRTQHRGKVKYREIEHQVLYGKIVRYTTIEGDNWYNEKKREYERHEMPKDIFPSPFETDYIYFPTIHRFYIKPNGKVSIKGTITFLLGAFDNVVSPDEDVSIRLMQSQDVIDSIINAQSIKSLKVNLSYTNDDVGDVAQEAMDKLMKDANIGVVDATLKPDGTGELNKDSTMIRGYLELAKDHGTAEASVINEQGDKDRIVTKDHPDKIAVSATDDTFTNELFMKEMRRLKK